MTARCRCGRIVVGDDERRQAVDRERRSGRARRRVRLRDLTPPRSRAARPSSIAARGHRRRREPTEDAGPDRNDRAAAARSPAPGRRCGPAAAAAPVSARARGWRRRLDRRPTRGQRRRVPAGRRAASRRRPRAPGSRAIATPAVRRASSPTRAPARSTAPDDEEGERQLVVGAEQRDHELLGPGRREVDDRGADGDDRRRAPATGRRPARPRRGRRGRDEPARAAPARRHGRGGGGASGSVGRRRGRGVGLAHVEPYRHAVTVACAGVTPADAARYARTSWRRNSTYASANITTVRATSSTICGHTSRIDWSSDRSDGSCSWVLTDWPRLPGAEHLVASGS